MTTIESPSGTVTATVVVPTFNEAGNIAVLLERLSALGPDSLISEVIFVDDSTDDTPDVIAREGAASDLTVRLLHRIGDERAGGLSGAVVAGIEMASSPWVVVMDGDLQHPPEDIPRLLAATHERDIVIASRYCDGGGADGLADGRRRMVSKGATWLAATLFPRRLAPCSDTMTGFFALRRSAVDLKSLRPQGFKILLEMLGRNQLRVVEVPFHFAQRHSGVSKARMSQGIRFAGQLARLRVDGWRSTLTSKLTSFAFVGLLGLVLDVGLFNVLLHVVEAPVAKLLSSATAIVASYFLNARWTWPDRRSARPLRQLAAFVAVSGVGLGLAELCLVTSHYGLGLTSRLSDNISANVVGLALGLVWRFYAYERWVFPESTMALTALAQDLESPSALLRGMTAPPSRPAVDLDATSTH